MLLRTSMVWLNGFIFLLFGLGYLAAPEFFASLVDMSFSEPNALIDARALYGGMLVGISIWYFYCAINESRIYFGLLSAFFIASGLLSGRVIGVLLSGSPNRINLFYIATEVLVVTLLAFSLRTQSREQ